MNFHRIITGLKEFGWRGALLFLPLFGYIGLWCYVYNSKELDKIINRETEIISKSYKSIASDILDASDDEKNKMLRPSRGKGKDWHKKNKCKNHFWGFEENDDGTVNVWIMVDKIPNNKDMVKDNENDSVYVKTISKEEPIDFYGDLMTIASVGFAVVFILTIFGARVAFVYAKSRDDFMEAAVHDLITPTSSLRSFLRKHPDEYVRNLSENTVRMVENIKEFARLNGKRAKPQKEIVDLKKVYDEAYYLFREEIREMFDGRDIDTAEPEEGVLAIGDKLLISQIIWNLLGNACKYAIPYGDVQIKFSVNKKTVAISVIDKGEGLTWFQRRKVFARYYRARNLMSCGKGGFGIGLYNSRKFARMMGGDLRVSANKPSGCIFTLILPKA